LSFTVTTTAADRVAAELLAVPITKGAEFGPGADAVDAALGGGLAAFLAEAGFDGKLGETLAVPTAGRLRAKAALLVGVGDPAELTVDGARRPSRAERARSPRSRRPSPSPAPSSRSPTPRKRSRRDSCSAATSTSSTRATRRRRS
jgi:leucyl aminopeptidase